MKNLFLFCFLFFWMLTNVFSQSESVIAYKYKAKDHIGIILLKCNVGYYYSGPHIFVDEIFSYEIKGNNIIRTFDPEHSFRQRIDTLIINKKSVQEVNGLSFKKLNSRKRDKLIKSFENPLAEMGSFKIFLKRSSACENKKS